MLGGTRSEEHDRGRFGVESVWVSSSSQINLVFLLLDTAVKILRSCESQPEGWENPSIIKRGIVVQYVRRSIACYFVDLALYPIC